MSHNDKERGNRSASAKSNIKLAPPAASETTHRNRFARRVFRVVTQFGMIGAILATGLFGAVFINSIEAARPPSREGHGGHSEGGGGHGGHEEHESGNAERSVTFNSASFKNAHLGLATASSRTLHPHLTLNGIITPNEERVVQVSPRFPGVVRRITKQLGSTVRRGDILVSIEGDKDLKRYVVNSAIDGTVISRRVGLGEHVERNDKLMVIADLRTVWVDFRVFARDFNKLRLHQPVEISLSSGGPSVMAKIAYISPIGMADTQSMLARAIVDNPDGSLRPGLFVTGKVRIGEQKAFVAVRNSAIQFLDGKPVVFVERKGENDSHKKHDDHDEHRKKEKAHGTSSEDKHDHDEEPQNLRHFVARNVELGPTDGRFTEIYFGILPGQTYVADNSFILKAELSKGMAAHSH